MISSRRDWLRIMLTESEKVAIESEVGRWEVVMVRVRNVGQDRKTRKMWRWAGQSLALVKPMFSNKKENKNKNLKKIKKIKDTEKL